MNTYSALILLAAALLHTAQVQPRQGIDGTDWLLAQQSALADIRPTPTTRVGASFYGFGWRSARSRAGA